MTIEGMHYDFLDRFNEAASNKYRGLEIPEIDWRLNQAQTLCIRMLAQPRMARQAGFEASQRAVDDFSTIVVNQKDGQPASVFDDNSYVTSFPQDYYFGVSCYADVEKKGCGVKKARCYPAQHDDLHEENAFTKSSYEWGEVNTRPFEGGLRIFTDGTFSVKRACFNYVREPKYMHYAQGYQDGTYRLPDGTPLTGKQDCELPESSHPLIVSLAVALATGDMRLEDYAVRKDMLNYELK